MGACSPRKIWNSVYTSQIASDAIWDKISRTFWWHILTHANNHTQSRFLDRENRGGGGDSSPPSFVWNWLGIDIVILPLHRNAMKPLWQAFQRINHWRWYIIISKSYSSLISVSCSVSMHGISSVIQTYLIHRLIVRIKKAKLIFLQSATIQSHKVYSTCTNSYVSKIVDLSHSGVFSCACSNACCL